MALRWSLSWWQLCRGTFSPGTASLLVCSLCLSTWHTGSCSVEVSCSYLLEDAPISPLISFSNVYILCFLPFENYKMITRCQSNKARALPASHSQMVGLWVSTTTMVLWFYGICKTVHFLAAPTSAVWVPFPPFLHEIWIWLLSLMAIESLTP